MSSNILISLYEIFLWSRNTIFDSFWTFLLLWLYLTLWATFSPSLSRHRRGRPQHLVRSLRLPQDRGLPQSLVIGDTCTVCQKIADWLCQADSRSVMFDVLPGFEFGLFHQTYNELVKSAEIGCKSCALIKNTFPQCRPVPEVTSANESKNEHVTLTHGKFWLDIAYGNHQTPYSTRKKALLSHFKLFYEHDFYRNAHADARLKLRAAEGSPHRAVARRIHPTIPDLNLARSWVQECVSNHASCKNSWNITSPTRLLSLESVPRDSIVRLVECYDSSHIYVALSHCWGEYQQLRTLKGNYEMHRMGLDVSILPRTFQDGITVALSLGVQYIWIDSLCIIQDSKEDWETECSRMALVYSNALLTIAASDAANSSIGFLHVYEEKKDRECTIRCSGRQSHDSSGHAPADFVIEYVSGHGAKSLPQARLSTRGWALQERLLSNRFISFRDGRMEWECNTYDCSDDRHYPNRRRSNFGLITKNPIASLRTPSLLHQYWLNVVRKYSTCALSEPSDRLPALAGLAEAFLVALGPSDEYLAGIWKNDLIQGLCWNQTNSDIVHGSPWSDTKDDSKQKEENKLQGPSWSWGSRSSGVAFNLFRDQPTSMDEVWRPKGISSGVIRSGRGNFGQVSSGTLTIRGRLERILVLDHIFDGCIPYCRPELRAVLPSNRNLLARISLDGYKDSKIRPFLDHEKQAFALYLASNSHRDSTHHWYALVLEEVVPCGTRRCFRRIGLLHGSSEDLSHRPGEQTSREEWFGDAEQITMDII